MQSKLSNLLQTYTALESAEKRQVVTQALLMLLVLASSAVLFAESMFYPGFSVKYFGFEPTLLAAFSVFCLVVVRLATRITLPGWVFSTLYWYIVPIVSVLAVLLQVGSLYIYSNFAFHHFHLHPEPTKTLAIYLVVLVIVSWQQAVVKQRPQWSFFVAPIIVWSMMVFFKWEYIGTWWHWLRREDGLFEYITAIGFLICGVIAVRLFQRVRRLAVVQPYRAGILTVLVLIAVGSFLVAGEEISWGQRLFGLQTPEEWSAINTQQEITLHNHKDVLPLVYQAYFVLAAYCAFAWIPVKFLRTLVPVRPRAVLTLFVPKWYLMPYFLPSLFYSTHRFTLGWSYYGVGTWEETTEAILSLGLLFFMFDMQRRLMPSIKPLLGKS